MSTSETRARLAEEQAAVLRALLADGEVPVGFSPEGVQLCARSLGHKRRQAVERIWPAVASCLGERFPERFAAFAAATALPVEGGPLADGRAFARTLADSEWTDEARLEVFAVDLRYRSCPDGLLTRRGMVLRLVRLRQRRRLLLGVRLPWLEVRVLSLPSW